MSQRSHSVPRHEGYLVEFKRFSGGISVKELSITLSAFANTEGGDLYIGVADSGRKEGVRVTPELLDAIQNAAREGCSPAVPIALQEIPISDSRSILKLHVEKSLRLHSVASGATFIRVGSQDKRVLGDELLRLAETKSQVSYEEHILDVGIEVLDLNAVEEYYSARKNISAIRPNLKPDELLLKMGLAVKKNSNLFIKAGAFILFGKTDEDTLLQRDFTFVRYDIEGKMYSFREDVSMPASRMIDRLMELIRPYNRHTTGMRGAKRQETLLYPETALREALVNAFAHRDYRIQGLRNECRLYPNRIEFISAGGLPSLITLDNIGSRHYSRNPKIMHALLLLGLVEELGQGVVLMKRALQENGNPPPEFSTSSEQVKVVFFKQPSSRESHNVKELLEDYFRSQEVISRRQLEAMLGVGKTTAKGIIRKLIEERYLEQIGKGSATRYRKNLTL